MLCKRASAYQKQQKVIARNVEPENRFSLTDEMTLSVYQQTDVLSYNLVRKGLNSIRVYFGLIGSWATVTSNFPNQGMKSPVYMLRITHQELHYHLNFVLLNNPYSSTPY
jgi:hypothetical protein